VSLRQELQRKNNPFHTQVTHQLPKNGGNQNGKQKHQKNGPFLRPLPFNHSGNRDLFFLKNNFGIDASI